MRSTPIGASCGADLTVWRQRLRFSVCSTTLLDLQQGARGQQGRPRERHLEGTCRVEAALTTRLNAARRAIGDTGEEQRLIKTLPRKGFRFFGDDFDVDAAPTDFDDGKSLW
jgi:hypothetical protein